MIEIFLINNMTAYVRVEKIGAMWISPTGGVINYQIMVDGACFSSRDKAEYDRVLAIFKKSAKSV